MRKLFENNLLTKLLIIISIKFYFYYRMFHRFMTSSKYIVYKSSLIPHFAEFMGSRAKKIYDTR